MRTEGRWTPEQIAARFDEVGQERMGLIDRLEADPQGGRLGREAQRLTLGRRPRRSGTARRHHHRP